MSNTSNNEKRLCDGFGLWRRSGCFMAVKLIRFYQQVLSLDTGWIGRLYPHQQTCRFYPRCSEYTIQAIQKYGIIKGLFLGSKRISRCHPGNPGGIDELE